MEGTERVEDRILRVLRYEIRQHLRSQQYVMLQGLLFAANEDQLRFILGMIKRNSEVITDLQDTVETLHTDRYQEGWNEGNKDARDEMSDKIKEAAEDAFDEALEYFLDNVLKELSEKDPLVYLEELRKERKEKNG